MNYLITKPPNIVFQVCVNLSFYIFLLFFCSIIGYGGYVPGVQSENQFGKTYGKHTLASAQGDFHRGIDHPVDQKFQTTAASSMVDHSYNTHPTAAQIVGVHREEDCYAKVSIKI